MADVTVAILQAASPTSTGSQSYTNTALGGLTPKAALFFTNYSETLGTEASHFAQTIGAFDGTEEWAFFGSSMDAQASTNTRARYSGDTAQAYDQAWCVAQMQGRAGTCRSFASHKLQQ